MNREHENLKAGLFILVGFVLAIVVIFTLSDLGKIFERQQTFKVYYQLNDGLQGLKVGAPVTIGDQLAGEVTQIEDKVVPTPSGSNRVIGKVITASIPEHYLLFENAIIELKAPLIGSGTSLNIRSVGDGQPYDEKGPFQGSLAGSSQVKELIREMGIEAKQREEVRKIIANIESITATLRDDIPQITSQAKLIMTDVHTASNDLKTATATVRDIMADLDQRREQLLDSIGQATASANQSLTMIRDLLIDKDLAIRQTIDNVHSVTQTAREKTMAQVTDAMDLALTALGHFNTTSEQLKTFVISQRPVLERTMANARITSDQLKLAAIEVRRSPWRLMYEPDEKELNTDNLYDAARSFAMAASTLDATAQSLQGLAHSQDVDHEEIEKILDHLETVFSKYKAAENAFWKQLKVKPGTP